ncbi:MAG: HEAT repeat domain-containing protein, partial [Bacillota bacterium]
GSNPWWKKSEAAYALGNLGATSASDALLDTLESENSDLRYQSALALAKIEGTKHLKRIINKLLELNFYPEDVILRLVEVIEEDIYSIMAELTTAEEVQKKIIALRSLGLQQDYRVLKWIKEYITVEDEKLVTACLTTAYQLGDVGEQEYFDLLITIKSNDSSLVRAKLAQVLEKFRSQKSRNVLKELMTDSQWQVRYNAAQSLLAHGEQGLLTLSRQLHNSDSFAQDMAWQTLHQEIIFNDLLESEISSNHPQLMKNIKNYLATKEGGSRELDGYFN